VRRVIVRYRVKPERVEENERLVRAVYEELHRAGPAGFRYATFKLDDGVTFVHVAEGDDPPLPGLDAFKEFQRDIAARCDEPPVASAAEQIGSFGRD
jgi:hypothetical protein